MSAAASTASAACCTNCCRERRRFPQNSPPGCYIVSLDHGFHETDQGAWYTIGMLARTEIVDRLR